MSAPLQNRLAGVLIGTAVGDALGLPAEGLSPERIRRRWKGEIGHHFVLGRGMISDDTEHAFFVAQSLLAHPDNPTNFQSSLAWKLRRTYVSACTRLTHTDPRAETGALAVAQIIAWEMQNPKDPAGVLNFLTKESNDPEWTTLLGKIDEACRSGMSVADFASRLGLQNGITGYVYHTVPMAIFAWLRHYGNFEAGLKAVIACGGDTEAVGAITGALFGAGLDWRAFPGFGGRESRSGQGHFHFSKGSLPVWPNRRLPEPVSNLSPIFCPH